MDWTSILHELGTIIGALAAAIAAISSLVNGRTLRNGSEHPGALRVTEGRFKSGPRRSRAHKKPEKPRDWFKAPDV
jgi:hypothetical protein